MRDFQLVLLSDVLKPPMSGSRPSGGVNSENDGIPSLGGENIIAWGGVSYDVVKKIPVEFYVKMPKGKLFDFDVLINKDGAQTGKVGLYRKIFEEAAINEHLFILRPENSDKLDQVYLYYTLLLNETQRKIERRITGSAQPGLNSQFVNHVTIPFCRPPQQKKIARILKTVDEAIDKTEAMIEKYSQIKIGMMQDLFTRGLTPDGKLRTARSEAPELYQETPIGWIPEEWNCAELEAVLAPVPNNIRSGPFGSALLKSELVEEGIPFLGIDNIHVERFDAQYKRFVSERKFNELQRYAVRPEDVVITIMGTVGRCAVVPRDIERALSSKHLWTMTFDQGAVIPELVCWQLNYAPWVKAWFRRETQGGIMDAIQSRTLRTLKLPLPPLPEQQLIMKRFDVLQGTLRTETEKLAKLRHQKSGLMHDLLTGERPVKVDDPELADV